MNKTIGERIHQLKNAPLGSFSKRRLSAHLGSPSQQDQSDLLKVASQVMADPVAVRRLSERVIEIMRLDLQQYRERDGQRGNEQRGGQR